MVSNAVGSFHTAVPAGYGLRAYGVDIFFVLSGFLITSLLLIDRGKANYYHNFYWKRALRILPVYFVHLVLTQWVVGNAWGYIWLSLIFLVNFSSRFHVDSKGTAWTLSIEEQFYLIWPNFVNRLRVTSLYYLAFGLVFTSVLLRIIMPLATHAMAITYTPYRFDGLGLGAILALQWFNQEERPRPIQTLLNILNSKVLFVLAIAGTVAIVCLPASLLLTGALLGNINYLAYCLVRRIVMQPERKPSWLAGRILVFFGSISYSFYLYHPIFLNLMAQHFRPIDATRPGEAWALFTFCFGGTLILSTVSLYAMELPIQRLRRYVLRPS
ncbi:acyltransferase family protein [Tunturiibacter psychrotolerans]|uniref:acyltransferase family protein n=1 Tax=Tunturiibacter psychrotolerans TaxID=3069686 RepID=UPI003D25D13A